jgi:peroxiredoxin
MNDTESLNQLFADLHAHRVATFKPEDLAINVNQRKSLTENTDRSKFIKVGDAVGSLFLPEVDGGTVALDTLLQTGPVVFIFFRFAGCPTCNLALPYYQRQLYPALKSLGVSLVAISPQIPEKLRDIKERHRLEFPVVTDFGNQLGHRFGIVFTADEASQKSALEKGNNMGETTGTGTWDLPMPAVIVIDQEHIVRFVAVSPDWLVRTEADEIIDAVRGMTSTSKAASGT